MADAGDRAKAQDHFLVNVQNRHQQQQRPEQRGTVILPGLRVCGEGAGIVITHHDDQARAQDDGERAQAGRPIFAVAGIALIDGAERALDVADMGGIENGGTVTRRRIEEFTVGFAGFGDLLANQLNHITGSIDWHLGDARAVNEVISALLGIDVDARVGSLVSAGELSFAQSLVHLPGDADLGIPKIDLGIVDVPDQRLHGACWSLAADSVLNRSGILCEGCENGQRAECFQALYSAFEETTYH
jgi:hypothetical protein